MPQGWTQIALETPSPKDTWGRRGCSGVWAAMRQGCPGSSLPRRRGTPEVCHSGTPSHPRFYVRVKSHPTMPGQAGHGAQTKKESGERRVQVWGIWGAMGPVERQWSLETEFRVKPFSPGCAGRVQLCSTSWGREASRAENRHK